MKVRGLSFVLGMFSLFVLTRAQTKDKSSSGCWPWPPTMDAVITSQQTDKVLFETYDIRFVEVTILPGQKQELGETRWPSALLFFEPQPKGMETSYDG